MRGELIEMGLIIILGIIVYILWLTCFRYFYFVIKYQKNKTGIPLQKQMEKQEVIDFLKQVDYPDLKAVYIFTFFLFCKIF